ncbi:MAG: hypothetical protein C5B50_10465 [Verrucomicrobia bacterium]|nr:MAG: hypothetical protein C5B50_10465 [Verrucomicrobiota bacterium]
MVYPCPCCGYMSFCEPPGSYEICEICFWEDDLVQLAFPDFAGGANKCSLIEAQDNFPKYGACEQRVRPHVRPATAEDVRDAFWRPLNPSLDRYLHWKNLEDHDSWQKVKERPNLCVYYWRPDYWLVSGA